jgi:hypothetical protein
MLNTRMRNLKKFETILYASISFLVGLSSNYYQQALNYASASESQSLDVTSRVAITSNSIIYKVLGIALGSSISAEILSLSVNIIFTFLLLNGLGKIYLLLKFSRKNSILLSTFSVSSYTFASPFAYDVQVTGPITQARLTPILVIYLIIVLAESDLNKANLKLYIVITLALWTHLVIGIFLTTFTIGLYLYRKDARRKINNQTVALLAILSGFVFLYLWQKIGTNLDKSAGNYLFSARSESFCLHYTNFFNVFDSDNRRRTFSAALASIGFLFALVTGNKYRENTELSEISGHNLTAFKIIKMLYFFTLVITIVLNTILIIPNPLSAYSLGAMPLRFIDSANIFMFPILMYLIRNRLGEKWITSLLVVLIVGRIVNARFLGFLISENEVHFTIMFVAMISISVYYNSGKANASAMNNKFVEVTSTIVIVLFVFVQFNHQSQHSDINWKDIKNLSSIKGFKKSTILTAPEIRFPTGENLNNELLSHSELQSVLYVRESEFYVNEMLMRYYSTDLPKYFKENSCALTPSNEVHKNWADRTQDEWAALSSKDHFKFVVTPSQWRLNMKPVKSILIYKGNKSSEVTIYKP